MLLVQFLVLAFTGAAWWLARRDLGSRPAPPLSAAAQADAHELEQLCVTLASLVTDLTGRIEAVERQMASLPAEDSGRRQAARNNQEGHGEKGRGDPAPTPLPVGAGEPRPLIPSGPVLSGPVLPTPPQEPGRAEPEVAAHAPLYALLDAGITDPAEITRRTGLGRGEVDLILSLRARRAL